MALIISLITISITISLVTALLLCICRRNKSKTNPNLNPELIRYNNGLNCVSIEETDGHCRQIHNKQMTLNRALPDIPSMMSSSSHSTSDEMDSKQDISEVERKNGSLGRPMKARAPQPPNHRFNGQVLTTPTASDSHHSYARIKDNAVIDSSTENDTDDYCDPQLCTAVSSSHFSVRNTVESNDDNDMSPPVPAKRFTTSETTYSASNAIANRVVSEDIPYMTPPSVRAHNIETLSLISNDEIGGNSTKNEISYNTISVREPLAKVLAERESSEHHYNEVEEERVSSFYEEIAGSTASSVTYSKIGDILSHNNDNNVTQAMNPNHCLNAVNDEPPALPSIESLMQVSAESNSSTSPQPSNKSFDQQFGSGFTNNFPKDLYSSVDKKTKSYNRQTMHCVPDSGNDFDNLYAKVQKGVHNSVKEGAHQRPSSVGENRSDPCLGDSFSNIISDDSMPPPLPPPINKFHPRSSRTISMYDSSNTVPNNSVFSHQRRYSSGNQSINEWRKDQSEEYLNYESIPNNDIYLESDPGYEVIKKKSQVTNYKSHISANSLHNGDLSQPSASGLDPGYEAINFDELDNDPAYETISKKVNTNNQIEIIEPGYEVIKKVSKSHKQYSPPFDQNISVNISESEPEYERIRYRKVSDEELDSEPKYASISRTVDYFEDIEEDEPLSERL